MYIDFESEEPPIVFAARVSTRHTWLTCHTSQSLFIRASLNTSLTPFDLSTGLRVSIFEAQQVIVLTITVTVAINDYLQFVL